ncbi:Ni/Fe hydrogenase subunit alpha [candidate division KSB3 bacterium]|uniref:Ni/Fe hydrogenase subunit alpha n=1 Tax=candidate division KSB3 bacterium TaxID=2044937 RepID=A0A9D5JYF5_9BACT|nr:Ni/Fe hydrogenase subunit alpha [candidate division KSB3 bacterium]MBD3326664.1 Ni/Fe hydrogenase subunit alpha [candidate division KSB3 bacterium]
MPNTVKVDVHHLTRVEGHGNIKVDVANGELKECKLEIVEAPRFFEAMLKGRHYDEAALITSRICGICSMGHQMASLRATEDAFGIQTSKQEELLRRLMNCGEYFESHVLHVYFLAVPDFAGAKSVLPLVNTHKDAVIQALKLKKLGHEVGDMVGGRLIHSMATNVKAMTKVPTAKTLHEIIDRLKDAKKELLIGAELLKALPIPEFERETEYISLYNEGEYALLKGNIYSSDTGETSYKNYRQMTNEYLCDHSTAKRTKHSRESFMVGALARFNNSYEWLSDDAKQLADDLGLKAPCHNPYLITVAQFVELMHIADDCIEAAEELLQMQPQLEDRSFPLKAGTGVGAVEVPRGILYHEYTYNDQGYMEKANCIIPTGQNLQNIEDDMKALVPTILDKSQEDITLRLEMLVRAYDPCISCSAHLLTVEFV